MAETARVTVPVFTFLLTDKEEVYLQRRFNTGYFDGYYEPPVGKLDHGEFPVRTAVRETMEEAGISVSELDLELFHSYTNLTGGEPWLGLFFRTRSWAGEPFIRVPQKCDDAGWFGLDCLPMLTPQVADAAARVVTAASIEMCVYDSIPSR